MRRFPWFSLILLVLYIIVAGLAAFGFASGAASKTTAEIYQSPSLQHWLGTDIFGRDIFSRAVQGTVIAFSVGAFSALIALVIGTVFGALAGYFGGRTEAVIVWLYTTWDSIPYILLLAAFAWVLGTGIGNLFFALGLTSWVTTCRLVRMEVMKHKARDYVTAARALGMSDLRILIHHILPNLRPLLLVQFGLVFVLAVKIEVILSFLGLGVPPGTPSWGLMIDDGKQEIAKGFWWNVLAGSGFMFGLVLAVNLLIEYFREDSDSSIPRSQ